MSFRQYSVLDRILTEADHFVKSVVRPVQSTTRTSPAEGVDEAKLSEEETRHVAGLMRVDHTGEICAQALYRGQAVVAKGEATRAHLHHAADEEYDHLGWCETRLEQLGANKSVFNPLWYCGSFTIGAVAGMISDKVSYGFVVETEKQVMVHLEEHLQQLPQHDKKSKAILQQMKLDEQMHADSAKAAGGIELPIWVKLIMKAQSKVMTTVAYRM